MSTGDFIGRAEAQRCRARGIEDRVGFVADLRAVLAATADSDVPLQIPTADIEALIERRMPVQESHLLALYGAEGGALRREFGVDRRGSVGKIRRALEKGAARALAVKPAPDRSVARGAKEQKTTVAGAASFPPDVAGDGGEGAGGAPEVASPPPSSDAAIECLAGGAVLVPPQGAPVPGQTGEAVPPSASPTQTPPLETPAVDAGVATAPLAPSAAGEGAAGANAPPPAIFDPDFDVVRVFYQVEALAYSQASKFLRDDPVASAIASLRRDRDDWQEAWEQATAEALAARGRIDVIERALAALEAVAA
jgi:hypothetical protein